MRGTLSHAVEFSLHAGIIPAYAGNTSMVDNWYDHVRDHPRVCGEHPNTSSTIRADTGSSPRMRGTLASSRHTGYHSGIIPAYAGNTLSLSINVDVFWDHPRVCGEHSKECVPIWDNQGSSPRMRGTHPSSRLYLRCCGIIPAYAGNTGLMSANDLPIRDHPRVCGEHALFASAKAEPLGSSPRMRGTPRGIHLGYVGHGIIPAYAGNTIIRSRSRKMRWDHPRVCGEH